MTRKKMLYLFEATFSLVFTYYVMAWSGIAETSFSRLVLLVMGTGWIMVCAGIIYGYFRKEKE